MTRNVDQLRSIQTFEELIPFLEDDLDWPFPHGSQEYEFDDLTFEYTPDELGLEDEYAAKIKRIHQLRPLVTGQPWGIFFVEFENKKLPIVVLRRILSHLVLKQRKSANPADRARWNAGDLLFISAFAEEGTLQREIAFAHFHQDPGDQPTLRVLGWDGGDTPLKLEHVSQILRHRLSWPRNTADHAAWRKQWAGAFRYSIGQQIQTADMLARELARVARNIRDAAMALMKVESSRGPLRQMHEAFKAALIHDLTPEDFADTYAQTITYGLLTAAISRTDRSAGADSTFVLAEDIHNMVPITNPFLKEMLESFLKVGGRGTSSQPCLDFDELGVQDVVEMLRSSEMDLPAVLEDFGNRNPGEDPVIRFYEHFLETYNNELRIQRGVFYTPQPVVSHIVRSVHELLQTEFGLREGLASSITWGEMAAQMTASGKSFSIPEGTEAGSHFVVILDPATGTATFLVEVIDVIFQTLTAKWKAHRLTAAQQREQWNNYVPAHLLPRLFGYELMMAPYAIAHMKIGLKLHETGYQFRSEERVRVYLTNALEPAQDFSDRFAFDIPALAHEAETVNSVKTQQLFVVVVGNPPYSIASWNNGAWIEGLTEDYKRTVRTEESQIQALSNDYIKFLRFAEWNCSRSGVGIVGMITGHGYLQGTQPRDLRRHLSETFHRIYCLDLHGSIRRANIIALDDEPVFQIMTGVAIIVAIKQTILELPAGTALHDLTGSLEHKFDTLTCSTAVQLASGDDFHDPQIPNYFFGASITPVALADDYARWMSLPELFGTGNRNADKEVFWATGFASQQDDLAMSFTREELEAKMIDLKDSTSFTALQEKYRLCTTDQWNYTNARVFIRKEKWEPYVKQVTYRPFDRRWTVANKHILTIPRTQVMSQLGSDGLNVGLVASRAVNDLHFAHCFVAKEPVDKISISSKTSTNAYVFPAFTRVDSRLYGSSLRPNISPRFISILSDNHCIDEGDDDKDVTLNAFKYIYGILHSGRYRTLYEELLKQDFARIPLTRNRDLYMKISVLGGSLVDAHLLNGPSPQLDAVCCIGTGPFFIERPSFSENTVWIDRLKSVGFANIPEEVWTFHIGGYQVCEKWLKDRKGRTLSDEEIVHYGRITASISQTIKIMAQVDEVVEEHGGWPGAFA